MPAADPDRGDPFPATRWSAVLAARSHDDAERSRAWNRIAAAYWKPVYKYVRLRWNRSPDDAADLTQEFFARAVDRDFLAGFDPAKARLRTFLRVCVDRLIQNEDKARHRLKRGGQADMIAIDVPGAERELSLVAPPGADDMESFYETEWVRELFCAAVEALRDECAARGKDVHFRIFERYDLADDDESPPVTYESLARELEIPVTDVTNHLAWARREFRRLTLEHLRTLCATDEEFRAEARSLLGMQLP